MAHGGEELILELAGALRLFLGLQQELFGPFAFRDVSRDLAEAAQAPRRVTQRGNHHAGPEPRSILAHSPTFFFESPMLRGNLQFIGGLALFDILPGVKAGEVLANDFLRFVAFDSFSPRIPCGNAAFGVEHKNRVAGYLRDEQTESLLALPQRFFSSPALGHVMKNDHATLEGAILTPQ